MECQWFNSFSRFCRVFWSYIIALARLVIWTIILFFLGLQRTLFMRSEIVGIDFKVIPLRCDMEDTDDKLAYIDKLCIENPELLGFQDEEFPFDDIIEDEEFPFDDYDDNGEENL